MCWHGPVGTGLSVRVPSRIASAAQARSSAGGPAVAVTSHRFLGNAVQTTTPFSAA